MYGPLVASANLRLSKEEFQELAKNAEGAAIPSYRF